MPNMESLPNESVTSAEKRRIFSHKAHAERQQEAGMILKNIAAGGILLAFMLMVMVMLVVARVASSSGLLERKPSYRVDHRA